MSRAIASAAVIAAVLLSSSNSFGRAVTYKLTGVTDGLIAITPSNIIRFDEPFVVEATGDTAGVQPVPSPPLPAGAVFNGSLAMLFGATPKGTVDMSITIKEMGTFDAVDLPYVYGWPGVGAGFGDFPHGDFLSFSSATLPSYDLVTNLTPSPVTATFEAGLDTDRGQILFDDPSQLLFSVSFVPEPESWGLMIVGLAGIGLATRLRRSASHPARG
jgi:hypothetical protein